VACITDRAQPNFGTIGRRLGTPADEAGHVVLRQPPASKLANLFRIDVRDHAYTGAPRRTGCEWRVEGEQSSVASECEAGEIGVSLAHGPLLSNLPYARTGRLLAIRVGDDCFEIELTDRSRAGLFIRRTRISPRAVPARPSDGGCPWSFGHEVRDEVERSRHHWARVHRA